MHIDAPKMNISSYVSSRSSMMKHNDEKIHISGVLKNDPVSPISRDLIKKELLLAEAKKGGGEGGKRRGGMDAGQNKMAKLKKAAADAKKAEQIIRYD